MKSRLGFLLVLLVLSSTLANKSVLGQGAPATLWCGSKTVECSFILWNGGGSVGFVVPGMVNMPIGTAYQGFHYCMHAAPPHAAAPKWPGCYGGIKDNFNSWGIIANGKFNS
jgi:hypothetical protein